MTEKTTYEKYQENLFNRGFAWRLSLFPEVEQATKALCETIDVLVGWIEENREDIAWLKNEMTNVNHFMEDEIKSANEQPETESLIKGIEENRKDIVSLKDNQLEFGERLNNLIEPKSKKQGAGGDIVGWPANEMEDEIKSVGDGDIVGPPETEWVIRPDNSTWARPCHSCGNTRIDESGILVQPLSGQRLQYLVRCPQCSCRTGHFDVLMQAIRSWNNISIRK